MLGMALGIICGCIPEAAIIICTETPVSRACKASKHAPSPCMPAIQKLHGRLQESHCCSECPQIAYLSCPYLSLVIQ